MGNEVEPNPEARVDRPEDASGGINLGSQSVEIPQDGGVIDHPESWDDIQNIVPHLPTIPDASQEQMFTAAALPPEGPSDTADPRALTDWTRQRRNRRYNGTLNFRGRRPLNKG